MHTKSKKDSFATGACLEKNKAAEQSAPPHGRLSYSRVRPLHRAPALLRRTDDLPMALAKVRNVKYNVS
ncbi:hypothetical protein GS8_2009 [Geobacillus stearothermophilus]|uniref:Uncharacterized protein n=1 Tax=Geobacillus stearothermophilus TaxID=1422 RepID=A0ABQ7HCC8_GEOSE|nr:hypothetical protein GS8_2009 [Geobacillus stearothermophilus]